MVSKCKYQRSPRYSWNIAKVGVKTPINHSINQDKPYGLFSPIDKLMTV
jgi:hypothetical protein